MESMEEIYQNHSKKVYTFLLSKTCNHELAEELTQETFFCAVNSINKFKGNSSVLTWLCGIAQNLWLKYLRDNKSFEDLSNYEDMKMVGQELKQKIQSQRKWVSKMSASIFYILNILKN